MKILPLNFSSVIKFKSKQTAKINGIDFLKVNLRSEINTLKSKINPIIPELYETRAKVLSGGILRAYLRLKSV